MIASHRRKRPAGKRRLVMLATALLTVLAGRPLLAPHPVVTSFIVSPDSQPTGPARPPGSPSASATSTSSPTSPTSPSSPTSPRSPSGPQHVVVLGDSVAAGTGCDCAPYATLLADALTKRDGQAIAVTNAGVGGLTTSGLLAQIDGDADVQSALATATVVVLTIGANDFDASVAANPACRDMGTVECSTAPAAALPTLLWMALQRINSLAPPGTPVLVTGYWNVFLDGDVGAAQGPDYEQTSDALTRSVNAIIAGVAVAGGAVYVDEYTPFKAHGVAGLTELLAADGDHPSSAGHALIAGLLLSALPAG